MKNKKGDVSSMLTYIIPIAGLLLIIIFISNFFGEAEPAAKDEVCRGALSVQAGIAESLGLESLQYIPDACRYDEVIIPDTDPKDVEREIIKLMDRCWWRMGEGKINPFAKNFVLFDFESKCITCFVFKAPYLEQPITEDKFLLDLMGIQAPNGENYHKYFNGHLIQKLGLGATALDELKMTKTITNDKYYSVIFLDLTTSKFKDWVDDRGKYMDKEDIDEYFEKYKKLPTSKTGLSKIYIEELNKAQECYDDSWFSQSGDLS